MNDYSVLFPSAVISHQQQPLHHLLTRLGFSFFSLQHMFCLHYIDTLFPFLLLTYTAVLCSLPVSDAFFLHADLCATALFAMYL